MMHPTQVAAFDDDAVAHFRRQGYVALPGFFYEPMNGTAMWVALHDATVENGRLEVIPRAFDRILAHDRDPESDHHSRCWPDENRAVPLELAAGGVVFFRLNTPNSTGPNRTDTDRAGLADHFLRTGLGKPVWLEKVQQGHLLCGPEGTAHGPIIGGPRYSRGVREYGEDMEAVLTREFAASSSALP